MRFSPREQGQAHFTEQAGPGEEQDQLTPVMTRLGAADLAAVDTLIAAGIGGSRAEILRWAVSRIPEHPAYAQLQDRVHEISQLKAQFLQARPDGATPRARRLASPSLRPGRSNRSAETVAVRVQSELSNPDKTERTGWHVWHDRGSTDGKTP